MTGYLKTTSTSSSPPSPSTTSTTRKRKPCSAKSPACSLRAAASSTPTKCWAKPQAAETAYTEHWRRHVTAHPDLSAEAKAAAFERIKLDRMATLSDQFQWLAAAGLPPTLYFQHYNFVVFAADKP